jgi:CSLREA domain-containing protein
MRLKPGDSILSTNRIRTQPLSPIPAPRRVPLAIRALRWRLTAALVAALAWAGLPAPVARAFTSTVTTTADENNADGDCSLREAVIAANTDAARNACTAGRGAGTIRLYASSFVISLAGAGWVPFLTNGE